MNSKTLIRFCTMIALVFVLAGCDRSNNTLTADQLIATGRQFYAEGNIEKAIESFKKAIKLKPGSSELHYELGVIFYKEWRKSYDMAQKRLLSDLIGRSDKDFSNDEKLLIKYGYKKEFYGLALSEFSEVLKYEPSHWRARYYIATDFFNNQKYEQAIEEFNKIIQLKSDYANNYTILGEAYLKTGQYELAINTLEKASHMNPSAYHYYILGLAYKKVNNWRKVDEMAKKLKEMKSDYYNRLLQY